MSDFILKDASSNLAFELENIGFDKSYLNKAVDKYRYKNIKIFHLSIPQANILKQCAISVGADCAVHRETITAKVDFTDCILGGSYSQLRKISEKLKKQPFSLSKLAEALMQELDFKLTPIEFKGIKFDFSKPYIVGILNLTQNSFSDGGEFYDYNDAIKQLYKLIQDGADIIDIGAESTKPFSTAVSADNQLEKLIPILSYIKDNNIKIPVSVDTRSAKVAELCIKNGVDIINDVSGFDFDSEMVKVIAKYSVPVIIQHSKGTPENMQINPEYENLIDEIYLKLKEKIDFAVKNGVNQKNIIVDPGIGFGKTSEQNIEIINRIEEFNSLKCPIMLGVSRKSFLQMSEASNEEKDIYTLAVNSRLMEKNVNFLRVHNVKLHKQLLLLGNIK